MSRILLNLCVLFKMEKSNIYIILVIYIIYIRAKSCQKKYEIKPLPKTLFL